jgi:RNA polymerase sigma factor (sigma-70 family)
MSTTVDPVSAPVPFPAQTAWSMILGAASRGTPEAERHFEAMVRAYWRPVFWYLSKKWGCPREDARDLTQEFFLRLYEKDFLEKAAPERGRFRTFLKLQLRNLVVDDLRRRNAQKRGGSAGRVPLTDEGKEPAWSGLGAEEEFDRVWAADLLTLAMAELEEALKREGREVQYRAFSTCCAGPAPMSYRQCAESLGIKEADVRGFIYRTRQRLKEILMRRARETVEHERDAEDELNGLLQLLKR